MRLLVHSRDRDALSVALIDDDRSLWEYHEEDRETFRSLGNVYLGRVVNIEPAIQSAFIDIGERRTAFLHVSDLHPAYRGARQVPVDRLGERPVRERGEERIQEILQRGQELLVQVSKESIGQKGPTVTTYIGLPGRSVVLMTGLDRPGISKKIVDDQERDRLRQLADQLPRIPNAGVIIRTAGRIRDLQQLTAEVEVLAASWAKICHSAGEGGGPILLHREADLLLRTARDLASDTIQEVVFDDPWAAEKFLEYSNQWNPGEAPPVRLHRSKSALFLEFGVESQINSLYDRKVALPSGGSLVIDETEALVAIDVNSGSSTSESDLESTALRTNLEAAREIARNLRLRDMGGVVVCDFIDMMEAENRRTLEGSFRELVRNDRAKIWFAKLSRFGLLELTRQRLGPSKDRAGREPCPTCLGRGTVRSARSVASGVIRELRQGIAKASSEEALITVGPPVRELLLGVRREDLDALEIEFGKRIVVNEGQDWSPERWTIQYR
ncbi:MAG TPA: Rne/Rng family ribonuclease [Planctomycetes bacterium]|nr:Rne/Rng family ribonuclease [Planctomycetota bacterium]HIK83089.1 Rne/Rng family ribonuclease [Planctomycetota bacterium]